ncbi:MAG TPA: plastocyanin/azurin family copper-binding protein [Chloroflexota bacterium]|nr:plastocyanin/azurin family copper-binding protein [Chloroflexota bacterium]
MSTLRRRGAASILALALALASLLPEAATAQAPAPAAPSASSGQTLDVVAGAFDPATQIEALEFLPKTVTITAGSTVRWLIHGFHNVALASGQPYPEPFLPLPAGGLQVNPLVADPVQPESVYRGVGYFNSGLPADPSQPFEWALTFAEPGTYEYACIIHPNMKAQVVVVPESSAVPSQAEVTAQGQRELAEYLAVAQEQASQQQSTMQPTVEGTTLWGVPMDIPSNPNTAVHKYFPQHLTVEVGDTVRWVNQALTEPHTVTFRAGAPREREFVPQPQASGPPLLVGNPRVIDPVVPPQPWDGQSYVGSGMIGPGMPAGSEFQLTFGTPGTFSYVCVLHEDLGMSGFVTVVPRGALPR